MKIVQSVVKSLGHNPVKSTLTLLTVGLGVGVLIIALSLSSTFSKLLDTALEQDGIIVTFANAEYSSEGELERARPPQTDENVLSIVKSDVQGVNAIAPALSPFWRDVKVGDRTYQVRTVIASDENYAEIMRLEPVAGALFTAEDVEQGNHVAVISETLAELLFGSIEQAVGGIIRPPAMQVRGPGADRAPVTQTLEVIGVFEDPDELRRKAYGIGDLVLPYTAALPAGVNTQMAERMFMSTVIMKVTGSDLASVESQLRTALTREYGDDLSLYVWEGTLQGASDSIQNARDTVTIFSLVVNLLGFVLLVTGSIGILSIMLVDVLGRGKEISLERAVGASKIDIVREYFTRAVILSLTSVIIGIVLSLALSRPLAELVLPVISTLSITAFAGGVIHPAAIAVGAAATLLIGGVFGVFPIFSTLRTGIADGIREA